MSELLVEPFDLQFMRTALAATLLVAIAAGAVGVHVVLRRMAFVGHAIGHAVLPGVVVAVLWSGALIIGALAAGVLAALAIGLVSLRHRIREDTAIGVVLSGMFALGVLLMSQAGEFRDLSHILFGNILAVTPGDLRWLALIAAVVVGALVLFHRELTLSAVDPTHAAASGIPVGLVRMGLLVLLAPTIVIGVDTVGIVLMTAMLVTPAATAALLSRRLVPMMLISVGIGIVSGIAGLLVSYHVGGSSGAAIVLVATGLFVLAWMVREGLDALGARRSAAERMPAADGPVSEPEPAEPVPISQPPRPSR
jgi:manganese/iron transport system permease protein